MKKVIMFFAVAIVAMACDNVAQYADQINTLSGNWTEITEKVTAFTGTLAEKQDGLKSLMGSMNLGEDMEAKMGEEGLEKLAGLKEQLMGEATKMTGLQEQVSGFVASWTEKTEVLNGLTAGLESGKLPTDVTEQISGLQEMVGTATENLGGWQETLASATGNIDGIKEQFNALKGAVMQ